MCGIILYHDVRPTIIQLVCIIWYGCRIIWIIYEMWWSFREQHGFNERFYSICILFIIRTHPNCVSCGFRSSYSCVDGGKCGELGGRTVQHNWSGKFRCKIDRDSGSSYWWCVRSKCLCIVVWNQSWLTSDPNSIPNLLARWIESYKTRRTVVAEKYDLPHTYV